MATKTKSPLKNKPLRSPGQSLDERIRQLVDDSAFAFVLVPGFFVVVAILEWYRWYFRLPPNPIVWSVLAVLAITISAVVLPRRRKEVARLRLGRDGERAVGQYLERLRSDGAQVFHDIPGEDFNIDHVLITASGIYLIETKTYSKPAKGEAVVVFDGESLAINRRNLTTAPVVQAKAGSHWLSKILEESTGKHFTVRPVLLFPGWFIQPTAEAKTSDVWVLNPKALPSFIENSRTQLNPEDQKLAAFHLSRYIRTHRSGSK